MSKEVVNVDLEKLRESYLKGDTQRIRSALSSYDRGYLDGDEMIEIMIDDIIDTLRHIALLS